MLRSFVRRFLPAEPHANSLLRRLFSAKHRELRRLERTVQQAGDGSVASGPFAGMRYGDASLGSGLTVKLLGTYEKELWPIIDQIIATAYPLIIDIGAAEGYYAVGLATRIPAARVIAFEAQESRHSALLKMASLNGVAKPIELLGYCTPPLLNQSLGTGSGRALIICDVEGFESELLDPGRVPALQHADVLVELHDFASPGIGELLKKRFMTTHTIARIVSQDRVLPDWPTKIAVPEKMKLAAMHEGRPGQMDWLWMESKSR